MTLGHWLTNCKIPKEPPGCGPTTCLNPQEILGIALTDCKIIWTKTSLNCRAILGIAFTGFKSAWKILGFGLHNCPKSEAILGVAASDCQNCWMWTNKLPESSENWRDCAPRFAIAIPIYRSLHTPRNPQKVSKRSSQASPPGVSKKCRKSPPNTDFDAFLTLFRVLWDFVDTFLTLQAGRPGKTFWDFLGISGPQGLGTPVYGGSNRNPRLQNPSKFMTFCVARWPCLGNFRQC